MKKPRFKVGQVVMWMGDGTSPLRIQGKHYDPSDGWEYNDHEDEWHFEDDLRPLTKRERGEAGGKAMSGNELEERCREFQSRITKLATVEPGKIWWASIKFPQVLAAFVRENETTNRAKENP